MDKTENSIIPSSMVRCVFIIQTYVYIHTHIYTIYTVYTYDICVFFFFGGELYIVKRQPWPLCHHGTPAFSDRRKSSNCGASCRAFSQASNPPQGISRKNPPLGATFFWKKSMVTIVRPKRISCEFWVSPGTQKCKKDWYFSCKCLSLRILCQIQS